MNLGKEDYLKSPISFVVCPPSPVPPKSVEIMHSMQSDTFDEEADQQLPCHSKTRTKPANADSAAACSVSFVVCPPSPKPANLATDMSLKESAHFGKTLNEQPPHHNMERRGSIMTLDENVAKKIASKWEIVSSNLSSSLKIESIENTPHLARKSNSLNMLGQQNSHSRMNMLRSSFRGTHLSALTCLIHKAW